MIRRIWEYWKDYQHRCKVHEQAVWLWKARARVDPYPVFPPPSVPHPFWGEGSE